MLYLFLNLFSLYDLFHCVEFEKADIKALIRAHDQNSSLRKNIPSFYEPEPMTPEFAFFTPPTNFLEELLEMRRNQYVPKTQQQTNIFMKNLFRNHLNAYKVIDSSDERDESNDKSSFYSLKDSNDNSDIDNSEDNSNKDTKTKEDSDSTFTDLNISDSDEKESSDNALRHISESSYPGSKDDELSDVFRLNSESVETIPTGRLVPLRPRPTEVTNKQGFESDVFRSNSESVETMPTTHKEVSLRPRPKEAVAKHKGYESNDFRSDLESFETMPTTHRPVSHRTRHTKVATKHKRLESDILRLHSKLLEPISTTHPPVSLRPRPTKAPTKHKRLKSDILRLHSKSLDPMPTSRPMSLRPRQTEATTKHRGKLEPNLLLGNKIIFFDEINKLSTPKRNQLNFVGNQVFIKKPFKVKHKLNFDNDKDIFKKMRQTTTRVKVLRMQTTSSATKKKLYSNGIKVQYGVRTQPTKTWMRTTAKRSPKPSFGVDTDWSIYGETSQKQESKASTTTTHKYTTTSQHRYASSIKYLRMPLSRSYLYKEMEDRHEGYMIVFLIELTRILAGKQKAAVYDVVKYADQIVFRQSKQLQWMGHPLLEETQKLAKMLKVTDIIVIKDQIANLHHMLVDRHEKLPVMINTILEYAETLYEDDEGRQLFDTLVELVGFPNIALTGYTLCNSLINAFLRPYRRLKDTQQLYELMETINLALKSPDTLRSQQQQHLQVGRGFGAVLNRPSVVHQPSPNKLGLQRKPFNISRPLRIRRKKKKRKHHHRLNKRKRDKRRLIRRYRPWYTQQLPTLTLTGKTPMTEVLLTRR